ITVCEVHGLHDWVVYPRSLLAWRLAASELGTEMTRAEELVRDCLPQAQMQQDLRLLAYLDFTEMWIATRRMDWEAWRSAFHRSLAYGGIAEFSLGLLVEEMEATCHRVGADETFVALCREMAEAYPRTGREAPLHQWYLAPTAPRDPASLGAG